MRGKPRFQIEVTDNGPELEQFIIRAVAESGTSGDSGDFWWRARPESFHICNVTPQLRKVILRDREVAFPIFHEVIRNGEYLGARLGILEVLYRWGDPSAEGFLLDFLSAGDETQIARSLLIVAQADSVTPSQLLLAAIKPFLRSESEWIAESAAAALLRVPSAENIGLVAQIARDDLDAPAEFLELLAPYQPGLVLLVARRRMGTPEAKRRKLANVVVAVVEHGDSMFIHEAFRLGRDLFESLGTEHPTCNYRNNLLRALAAYGTEEEADWMHSVLTSNEGTYERGLLLGRLSALGERAGFDHSQLLEYLKLPEFHEAASKALADLNRDSGNEASMKAIEKECPDRSRVEKAQAIFKIGGDRAIERALAALTNPKPYEHEAWLGFKWLAQGLSGERVTEKLFELGAIFTRPDATMVQDARTRNPNSEVAVFYDCLVECGAAVTWEFEDECSPPQHDALLQEIASQMLERLRVQHVRETHEKVGRSRQFTLEFISSNRLYRLRGGVSGRIYNSDAMQALINRVLEDQGFAERLIALQWPADEVSVSFLLGVPERVLEAQAVVELPLRQF